MLVSVIIPTYNRAKFIKEAIDSVVTQSYKHFEIIVVDDGSSDNTRDVLEPYIKKGLMKYIYQKNAGPAAARNTGIRASNGELIAFLDSDDLWVNNKLELQVNCLRNNPQFGMVYSNAYFFDRKREIKKIAYKQRYLKEGFIFEDIMMEKFHLNTPSLLIRKKNVFKVGLYDESFIIHEDREFAARFSLRSQIGLIDIPLIIVRKHDDNISSTTNLKWPMRKKFLEKMFSIEDVKKREDFSALKRRAYASSCYALSKFFYNCDKLQFLKFFIMSTFYYPFHLERQHFFLKKIFKTLFNMRG